MELIVQQFIRDAQTGVILGIIIAIGIVVLRKINP